MIFLLSDQKGEICLTTMQKPDFLQTAWQNPLQGRKWTILRVYLSSGIWKKNTSVIVTGGGCEVSSLRCRRRAVSSLACAVMSIKVAMKCWIRRTPGPGSHLSWNEDKKQWSRAWSFLQSVTRLCRLHSDDNFTCDWWFDLFSVSLSNPFWIHNFVWFWICSLIMCNVKKCSVCVFWFLCWEK